MSKQSFWFRRDLRLEDNMGLFHALQSKFGNSLFILMILFWTVAKKMMPSRFHPWKSFENKYAITEIESSLLVQKRKNFMFGNHFYKNMTSKKFFQQRLRTVRDTTWYCNLWTLETNKPLLILLRIKLFSKKKKSQSWWIAIYGLHSFKNKWLIKSMAPVQEYDTAVSFF
jgi:deoxyribodipyrimidine photo-lyase